MKKNLRMLLIMLAVLVVVGGGAAALLLTMPAQEEGDPLPFLFFHRHRLFWKPTRRSSPLCLSREHRGQLSSSSPWKRGPPLPEELPLREQLFQHPVHGGGLGELLTLPPLPSPLACRPWRTCRPPRTWVSRENLEQFGPFRRERQHPSPSITRTAPLRRLWWATRLARPRAHMC